MQPSNNNMRPVALPFMNPGAQPPKLGSNKSAQRGREPMGRGQPIPVSTTMAEKTSRVVQEGATFVTDAVSYGWNSVVAAVSPANAKDATLKNHALAEKLPPDGEAVRRAWHGMSVQDIDDKRAAIEAKLRLAQLTNQNSAPIVQVKSAIKKLHQE